MANVTMTFSAETAAAVQALVKIVDATGKIETGFQKTHAPAQKTHEHVSHLQHAVQDVTKEVGSMVAGFFTLEGVKSIIEGVVESLHAAQEAIKKFHQSSAGADSLPDTIKNLPAFKKK